MANYDKSVYKLFLCRELLSLANFCKCQLHVILVQGVVKSHIVRNLALCICKKKVTDHLRSNELAQQFNFVTHVEICINQYHCHYHLSRIVRKTDFCLGENKGADQLRGNREADQRLCFRYTDSTISLLLKSEISSF